MLFKTDDIKKKSMGWWKVELLTTMSISVVLNCDTVLLGCSCIVVIQFSVQPPSPSLLMCLLTLDVMKIKQFFV